MSEIKRLPCPICVDLIITEPELTKTLQAQLDAEKPYLAHKGTCRLPIWGYQKDGDYVGYGKCTCGLEALKEFDK